MDYLTLSADLACIEADKAVLMLESCEYFTEGKKQAPEPVVQKEGLFQRALDKLGEMVDAIRDWIHEHFGSQKVQPDTTMEISADELEAHKKRTEALTVLEREIKHQKRWKKLAALMTAVAAGGIAYGVHKNKTVKLQADQINKLQQELNENTRRAKKLQVIFEKMKISRQAYKEKYNILKSDVEKSGNKKAVERAEKKAEAKVTEQNKEKIKQINKTEKKVEREENPNTLVSIVNGVTKAVSGEYGLAKKLKKGVKIAKVVTGNGGKPKSNTQGQQRRRPNPTKKRTSNPQKRK